MITEKYASLWMADLMSSIDHENISEKQAILESTIKKLVNDESRLQLAYLHGSTAKLLTTPLSDIDLAFLYPPEDVKVITNHKTILLRLIGFFEQEFPQWNLDIRLLNNAPWDFCFAVINGRLLYAKNEDMRAQYEMEVITRYLDFKPIIDYYLTVQKQMLLGDLPR